MDETEQHEAVRPEHRIQGEAGLSTKRLSALLLARIRGLRPTDVREDEVAYAYALQRWDLAAVDLRFAREPVEHAGWKLAGRLTSIAYIAFSLWLIALGVTLSA